MRPIRFIRALFALFAIFLAAFPAFAGMPAPSTPDDTLVAVPVLRMSTRSTEERGEVSYLIILENASTGKKHSISIDVLSSEDYRYSRDIPPGEYILREYASRGLINAPNREMQTRKTLIVEKGKLSLLPVKVVSILFNRRGDDRQTYYVGFEEFDDRQRDRMLAVLMQDKNYPKWGH